MSEQGPSIGWVRAAGDPHAIGLVLGRAGRGAVHDVLLRSEYWQAVTDPCHAARVARMGAATRARFPEVWQELTGLAEGLQLPLEQVLAWNARGDLMSNVPDGCTTVQLPGATSVIGHNEDGLPGFHGQCFIAEVAPEGAPGFVAFCYPGSLPGHTFAATRAGLAQAVNNLRLSVMPAAVPRMVLGRAVLACADRAAALALLSDTPATGGFHFTLGQCGESDLVSVEFGGGACAHRRLAQPAVHANHALFLDPEGGQVVTASSRDRQARGSALIALGAREPLALLRDTAGPGLPIHRTAPDDPDCENTLATAILSVGQNGVDWRIYDQHSRQPVYTAERHWR